MGAPRPRGKRWWRGLPLLLCLALAPTQPVMAGESGALATPAPLRLGRGISLAGWFNWANVNPAGGYASQPLRKQGALAGGELDRLRQMGFDFVRLPVDPGVLLSVPDARRAQLMGEMGDTVRTIQAHGLTVVWDYHPRTRKQAWGHDVIFADGAPMADRYRALLTETARFLAQFPVSRTALELINEPPQGCGGFGFDYSGLDTAAWRAARAGDARLPLIIEGGCFASIDSLVRLDLSAYRSDPAVLFSFHFYEPAVFAQQGDPDSGTDYLRNLGRVPFPARDGADRVFGQLAANLADNQAGPGGGPLPPDAQRGAIAASRGAITRYFANHTDVSWITQRFDTVSQWANAQGISPDRIILGEFDAIRQRGPRGASDDDRGHWIGDVRRAAEQRHMPWAFWAYYDPQNRMSLVIAPQRQPDPVVVAALGLRASGPMPPQ